MLREEVKLRSSVYSCLFNGLLVLLTQKNLRIDFLGEDKHDKV